VLTSIRFSLDNGSRTNQLKTNDHYITFFSFYWVI